MKKLLTVILCAVILLTLVTGCAKPNDALVITGTDADRGSETVESQPDPDPSEGPTDPDSQGGFTFQPKVSSVYLDEIFGETMVQTWYNIVDAALAGEETFACPDQWTYDWVIYQFSDRCFPVLSELIEPSYDPVENGVAHLVYKTSREEFETKLAAFETLVEDILNQTMKPEYTDLEKALSLYRYFTATYQYDYDASEKMYDEAVDYLSSYRLLTEGTGVCQEISAAYSYLLLQVGVDATIMMGGDHQWSYVRINGHNYHIDPTFGIGDFTNLQYFMMTDELRSVDYTPDQYIVASAFTQEYGAPDYVADDDTFAPIWNTYLESFDHDTHTMRCYVYNESASKVYQEFDYEGF